MLPRNRSGFTVIAPVILGLVVAGWVVSASRWTGSRADENAPDLQFVPRDVDADLRQRGAAFEIRASPESVVTGQESVEVVTRDARIRPRFAAAMPGELLAIGSTRRTAWLVIVEGQPDGIDPEPSGRSDRVRLYGLVDAESGSLLWTQRTDPLP